ncbi:hypothetical protein KY290_024999 [Solanum tuberosum]|uniref:Uncharacterized protein n=1 Tax=Solanum tuberosum TaxID=4113 RepID=A0ABQ7USJ0_SOLTU|nr:hypothetical protein KY284_023852 [Solanum tuberosum]KAH0754729.1 hypothetical protein KY290_024999 [Solanum tuberosum]
MASKSADSRNTSDLFGCHTISLSSDSSENATRWSCSKKRPSASTKKDANKPRSYPSGSLSGKDMQNFWGVEQKVKFEAL